jgi:AcrR family transcriptional regulator
MAAKAFSEQERERIRQRLLVRGRESFSRQGLRKTSVADLTKAAGIALGSFYLFFQSKEDLFFAVLEEEEKALREQIFPPQMLTQPLPRGSLKQLLLGGIQVMMENPLTRRL